MKFGEARFAGRGMLWVDNAAEAKQNGDEKVESESVVLWLIYTAELQWMGKGLNSPPFVYN